MDLPSPHAVLADDDDDYRALLASALDRSAFRVSQAADGRQLLEVVDAIRDATGTPPAVVISDVEMPECDGLCAARALRNASYAGVIVIITALHTQQVIDAARSSGADLLLFKPVSGSVLVREVLRVMHGRGTEA